MRSLCSIADCPKPLKRYGLCQMHDRRLRVHGDPLWAKRSPNTVERLASLIDASGDCWEWIGTIHHSGYGQTQIEGRATMAHRAVYEWLVGPIPAGLVLDHHCRNRACVNPDHLEVVTQRVNVRRSTFAHARRKPLVK